MKNNIALILIDIQKAAADPVYGKRNNPYAETNMAKLLNVFRESGHPIIHIQHLSKQPNSPFYSGKEGVEFMDIVSPLEDEPVFQKNVNSAFIGTSLEQTLRESKIDTVVIAGLTTDHCISTSVRMAGNLGFNVYLIADATFTFERKGFDGRIYSADTIHDAALASLHEEFATVMNTTNLIDFIT